MQRKSGKSFLRRLLIITIGAILGIGLTAIFLVDHTVYNTYIKERIVADARKQNIRIAIRQLDFTVPDLHLSGVQFVIPDTLIPIDIDKLTITPNVRGIFSSTPKASFEGEVYGGQFVAKAQFDRSTNTIGAASGLLNGLKLASVPHIASLGIGSGLLSFEVKHFRQQPLALASNISLSDLSLPPQTIAALMRLGNIPFIMSSPEMEITRLSAHISISDTNYQFSEISFSSSLGEIQGKIALTFADGTRPTIDGSLSISLSKQGRETLLPFLLPLSGGKLSSKTQQFSLTLSGNLPTPAIQCTPSPNTTASRRDSPSVVP